MTESATTFTNQFLIAMPALADPNFFHSVTYICEHNEDGAMGIVINRPLELKLGDVLNHMEIPVEDPRVATAQVFLGGPVQPERGFVLHRPPGAWDSMLQITPNLAITTSRDILNAIAQGDGPGDTLIALGYAGWGPGQLENEMAQNAWLSGPVDEAILFEASAATRWEAAAALMGVDLNLLSSDVGHA